MIVVVLLLFLCSSLDAGSEHLQDLKKLLGRVLGHADYFECVPVGDCFWYINSIGLLEISANQASAAETLDVKGGAEIVV